MQLIDTHLHFTWKTCAGRVGELIERARAAGVTGMIDIGIDLPGSRQAREHAAAYPEVWFAAGIHPSEAGKAEEGDLAGIRRLTADPRCVAIGEIGLDFYRDHTPPDIQERWLRRQLNMARETGKPVVIHDRKASRELLRVLDEEKYNGIDGPGGVFHCFAGGKNMAREVIDRGFYVSFTGNITYNKSDRPEVSLEIPMDRLLLETDSPFLAPVPRRGRENEPANLPYIAAKHASLRNISLEQVAEQTTRNAVQLFGLAP